jgi:WD40 repeat protein
MFASGIKTNFSTFLSCYISISRQSDIVAVADHDGHLGVYSFNGRALSSEWEGKIHNSCSGIGILPPGGHLVSTGYSTDRKLKLFTIGKSEKESIFDPEPAYVSEIGSGASALSAHPQEPIVACAGFPDRYSANHEPNIRFFCIASSESTTEEPKTKNSIAVLPAREPLHSRYFVNSFSWNNNGSLCGVAEGEVDDGWEGTNGVARVFRWEEDEKRWDPVFYTGFSQVVTRIIFHPNRNIAAIAYEDKIRFVDLENGAVIATKRKLYLWSGIMAFTPEGDYLAVGDYKSIIYIDPCNLSVEKSIPLGDSPNAILFNRDGSGLFVLFKNGYLQYINT